MRRARPDPSKMIVPRSLIGAPLEEIAAWVCSTCLTFGCSVHTAYLVAGRFVEGIERQRRAAAARQGEP